MKVSFLMQDTRGLYGAEMATLRLIRALRARGVDARAWLLVEDRLANGTPSPLAAALAAVGPVRGFTVGGRLSSSAAAAVARAAAEEGIGVVHSTGYKADVHAIWARQKSGGAFAVVATVHGWLGRKWAWKERFYGAVDLWALRRCDRVVALSGFYERVLRRHGLEPWRLTRIPTGLDAESVAGAAGGEALWEDSGVPFEPGKGCRDGHPGRGMAGAAHGRGPAVVAVARGRGRPPAGSFEALGGEGGRGRPGGVHRTHGKRGLFPPGARAGATVADRKLAGEHSGSDGVGPSGAGRRCRGNARNGLRRRHRGFAPVRGCVRAGDRHGTPRRLFRPRPGMGRRRPCPPFPRFRRGRHVPLPPRPLPRPLPSLPPPEIIPFSSPVLLPIPMPANP